MTDSQKKLQLQKLDAELKRAHAEYVAQFAELKKRQQKLYKAVLKRVEAEKAKAAIGEIRPKAPKK